MSAHLQRISVIIAVRNGAATLERALTSVFEQTHPDVELIVMDGASTDGTQTIVERHAGRIAYWESKADRGVYHAWNKALDHVTGDWICFLGADDRFAAPEVLKLMGNAVADAAPSQRVAYGRVHVVDRDGTVILAAGEPWAAVRSTFRTRMAIPHQATLHRRELFEVHGRFDEGYRICGDYELLLRELVEHEPLFVPGLILVEMGSGGLSNRPGSATTMAREFHRARHAHRLERLPEWLSFPVVRVALHGWIARMLGRRTADAAVRAYRTVVPRREPPRPDDA